VHGSTPPVRGTLDRDWLLKTFPNSFRRCFAILGC